MIDNNIIIEALKKTKNSLTFAQNQIDALLAGLSPPQTLNIIPNTYYAALPDHIFYARKDRCLVHPKSEAFTRNFGWNTSLHMDFGAKYEGKRLGIPITLVDSNTEKVKFTFEVSDESDDGFYYIGDVEDGLDKHIICFDPNTKIAYEIYSSDAVNKKAYSGAIFDFKTNDMRPLRFTSADAAGLPIILGLVRYDEIEAGAINHAIRFTVEKTSGSTWPGSHHTDGLFDVVADQRPPLGQFFRLKSSVDISKFSRTNQIILTAMRDYGIILADNGSDLYFSGCPDERWDNDDLGNLRSIKGSDVEAIDVSPLMISRNSYAARKI